MGINKIPRDKWKWKHSPKPVGWSKSSFKREVYSNTTLSQEIRKTSNKQPNHIQLEKEEKTKPQVSRRKEIIKIRVEINETETKQLQRSMKWKMGSLKR